MERTAVLTPAEEGGFIALNPETGTTTQGETVEEAVANLRETTVRQPSSKRQSRRHGGVRQRGASSHAWRTQGRDRCRLAAPG